MTEIMEWCVVFMWAPWKVVVSPPAARTHKTGKKYDAGTITPVHVSAAKNRGDTYKPHLYEMKRPAQVTLAKVSSVIFQTCCDLLWMIHTHGRRYSLDHEMYIFRPTIRMNTWIQAHWWNRMEWSRIESQPVSIEITSLLQNSPFLEVWYRRSHWCKANDTSARSLVSLPLFIASSNSSLSEK